MELGSRGAGGHVLAATINRRSFNRLLAGAAAGMTALDLKRALADEIRQPKMPVVMLDAGHGGVDPGAIGLAGTYEKDISLPTVMEVARQLAATKRFEVRFTRKDDEFIPLPQRVARARAAGADLFLSVPADAPPHRGGARPLGLHLVRAGLGPRSRGVGRAREQGRSGRRHRSVATRSRGQRHSHRSGAASDQRSLDPAGAGSGRRARPARADAEQQPPFRWLRRAEGARHTLGPGRDRLSFQSGAGAPAAPGFVPQRGRAKPGALDQRLFRRRREGLAPLTLTALSHVFARRGTNSMP